jgi:hypothetical protein
VLRRVFESKKKRMTGGLRILHNEEPHNFSYSSVSVIRMIESRLSQARLVACGRDHK